MYQQESWDFAVDLGLMQIFEAFDQTLDFAYRAGLHTAWVCEHFSLDLSREITSTLVILFWAGLLGRAEAAVAFEIPVAWERDFASWVEGFRCEVLLGEFCAGWDQAVGADEHHVPDEGSRAVR